MRPPDVTSQPDQEAVEVVLAGDLDMNATFRIEPEVYRLLTQHGIRRLVLNLAEVRFIDSAGVGALVSIRERAERFGVEMTLTNASGAVQRVLDLTGHHLVRP
jgi:anti-anti-sigma factor